MIARLDTPLEVKSNLSNLAYADDIAAIDTSQKRSQNFLDCIVRYSAEV